MQIALETEGAFGRTLTIELPADEINVSTEERIQDIAKKTKINGFRPGKVPLTLVRKNYGKQARAEVINDLMQQRFAAALKEHELIPIERPEVTDIEDDTGTGNVKFIAKFEVYPKVELTNLATLAIDKLELELTDNDVNEEKEKLLIDYGSWEEVDGIDATVTDGAKVIIDFVGKKDGVAFEGGTATNHELQIGSNSFIPGFEEAIIGMKSGEVRDIPLTFPADYQAEELAGSEVVFTVTLHEFFINTPAELNDDLAKKIGAESSDDIDNVLRTGLQRYAKNIIIEHIRPKVLEALYTAHPLELPEKLVAKYEQELNSEKANPANTAPEGMTPTEQAKRAIILDLVRDKIVKEFDLKIDSQKVYDRIMRVANMFGDHNLVFKLYQENQFLMEQINSLVLDEQISELILDKVEQPAKKLSLSEIKALSKE